jgi:hypothetical protein
MGSCDEVVGGEMDCRWAACGRPYWLADGVLDTFREGLIQIMLANGAGLWLSTALVATTLFACCYQTPRSIYLAVHSLVYDF